jgi:hypothetical protein
LDPSGQYWLAITVPHIILNILHVAEIGHQFTEAWKLTRRVLDRSHFPYFINKEIHYHRNELFSRAVAPREERFLDLRFWKVVERLNGETPTHNVGAGVSGNKDYRGVGPFLGEQAIYDRSGLLVTTDENGGSFDFQPPPAHVGHFLSDVLPWIYWGNTEQDKTTERQRFEAAMRIPELRAVIVGFIKPP